MVEDTILHIAANKEMSDILFVIVIYNIRRDESVAYRTLSELLSAEEMAENVYVHDNTDNNVMLHGAYNAGLREAEKRGKKMIVLLDDDTEVTKEYMEALQSCGREDDVYVPRLVNKKGQQLSPFSYRRDKGPFWRKRRKKLINSDKYVLTAFNSGCMMRCEALRALGGFAEDYPMDYLDFHMFLMFHDKKLKVRLLDVSLKHELSVENYRAGVSKERYMQLLSAEERFSDELGGEAKRIYKQRLVMRLVKWRLSNHPYIKETYQALRNG